jgi:hypothetical protein
MKSILDPTFRYTPSVGTDIRKTFARIRREQCANASQDAIAIERVDEVSPTVITPHARWSAKAIGSG